MTRQSRWLAGVLLDGVSRLQRRLGRLAGLPAAPAAGENAATDSRKSAGLEPPAPSSPSTGRHDVEIQAREREQFFSMVSHELRGPLHAMHAWLAVLSETGDEVARSRAIEVLKRNLAVHTRLVDDLIDAARITSGKLSIERRRCDLADVVRAVADSERPLAEERGIEIEVHAPEPVVVDGDRERLAQVVTNLLTNAIKYSDDGGRVKLRLAAEGEDAVLVVRDFGRGIATQALPRVFDLYAQADNEATEETAGLGLGLAIVENIVDQHGGGVRAFSDGPGEGALFEVRLPALEGPHPKQEEIPSPSPEVLDGIRILIGDSNRFLAEALGMAFEEAGARVEWASSPSAARSLAEAIQPDVFVCGFAEAPALELLRELRPALLRSIALVDSRSGELQSRMRGAGFEAILRRMTTPAEVRGQVVRLLGRQPSVLLVDDDRDSADSLALLLERRGFEVTCAYGMADALSVAGRAPSLDLVVTDINLPDGDGADLASRLRALGARRIVAVTGYALEELGDRAGRFDEVCRKPIALDELLAALAGD